MTDPKSDITSLAKQGNPRAIATLMNQSLQPKGITAKVALKDGCLQIMLESTQVPNQTSLVAFVRKGVTSLGISSVERVKVYGKQSGEEFPAWNQDFELIEQNIPNSFFVLEESDNNKSQLQTDSAKNVLEQFMNLRARTSIGISYQDLPPVLGLAKLAVQKFERSPDSKICPYLTEIIQKIIFYYEVSLECLGHKVQRTSVGNALFFGLGSVFAGIYPSDPIGKLMVSEFPDIPDKGFYPFDTVLTALWTRAGELTDELDDILNKPVDLDTLKSKQLKFTSSIQAPPAPPPPPVKAKASTATNNRRYAIVFALLFGALGVHKFFLGYIKEGLIMLTTTFFLISIIRNPNGLMFIVVNIMYIIAIIEGIIYLMKSDKEFTKTYVTRKRGWF